MSMPEQVGRYQVREELGQGGMATVYRAYDPKFETDVALKLIRADHSTNPSFRERFKQEAKTLISLHDSAIVPIYNFDEAEGLLFLTMRHMPGGSLKDVIDRHGPMSLSVALSVLRRLAPALDKAHRLGIIHRDIKPSNVLFDEHGDAYLSDFGIARQGVIGTAAQTATIIGTPEYMAPEQLLEGKLSQRSDIYQLGVMVFQMLAAQLPYKGTTGFSVGYKHVSEPIPSIEALNPALPAGTDRIIERAIAKKPEDRYASAGELVADLQALLGGTATAASPTATFAADETVVLSPTAAYPVAETPAVQPKAASAPPSAPMTSGRSGSRLVGAASAVGVLAVLLVVALWQGWIGPGFGGGGDEPEIAIVPVTDGAAETALAATSVPAAAATDTPTPTDTPAADTPTPAPVFVDPGATIRDIFVEQGVSATGEQGYFVVSDFDVVGADGAFCRAVAYFFSLNNDGAALQDFNDAFRTEDGNVSTATDFTPVTDQVRYNYGDVAVFIPLSELHLLAGSHDLEAELQVYCDGAFLGASDRAYFFVQQPPVRFARVEALVGTSDGVEEGIDIAVAFEIDGYQDVNCSLNAYFYDFQLNPLEDFNGVYTTTDGQVSVWDAFTPGFASTIYEEFVLFIPRSELHMVSGTHEINYDVEVFCDDAFIAASDYFSFYVTVP